MASQENEKPMWEVIDKMNEEYASLEDKYEMLKEEMKTAKEMKEHYFKIYEKVIDNLIWKVLKKDVSGDEEPDCLDEGLDMFEYSKLKKENICIIQKMRIEQSVKRLNDNDWNEDNNYARLKVENEKVISLYCWEDSDMEDSDSD